MHSAHTCQQIFCLVYLTAGQVHPVQKTAQDCARHLCYISVAIEGCCQGSDDACPYKPRFSQVLCAPCASAHASTVSDDCIIVLQSLQQCTLCRCAGTPCIRGFAQALPNHLHNQRLGAWFLAAQVHASLLLCGRTLDCQKARQPFQTPDSEQRAKRIGLPWDNREKRNHCGGCRTHASYLSDHILASHLT